MGLPGIPLASCVVTAKCVAAESSQHAKLVKEQVKTVSTSQRAGPRTSISSKQSRPYRNVLVGCPSPSNFDTFEVVFERAALTVV